MFGLSFRVEAGSSLAIIGPNGSGKTVLLDIERDLPLTGRDLLRAKAKVSGATTEEISRVLSSVHLAVSDAGRPIGTLSGGQFQRLLLALALVGGPSVLLFDEPTAGVDEPGEVGFYELFRKLQREQKLTVLLISHELNLVYRFADNVLCLSRRRSWLGPPVAILTPERLQEAYGTAMRFHVHDDSG